MEPVKMIVMSQAQARIVMELVVRELDQLRAQRVVSKENHARLRWLRMLAEDLEWAADEEVDDVIER